MTLSCARKPAASRHRNVAVPMNEQASGMDLAAEEIAETIVAARGVGDGVDRGAEHADLEIEADASDGAVGNEW